MPPCPAPQMPALVMNKSAAVARPTAAMNDCSYKSSDYGEIADVLDALLQKAEANLRFTKAIFRGQKRPFGWPGVESSILGKSKSTAFDFGISDDGGRSSDPAMETGQKSQQASSVAGNFALSEICELSPVSMDQARENAGTKRVNWDASGAISDIAVIVQSDESERCKKDYLEPPRSRSNLTNSKRSLVPVKDSGTGSMCSAIVASLRYHAVNAVNTDWSAQGHQATNMKELTSIVADKHNNYERRVAMLWRFLEDRHSSRAAYAYYSLTNLFLMCSILVSMAEVAEIAIWPHDHWGTAGNEIQVTIESVFAMELSLRFFACRNRLFFFHNVYNILDALSISPLILRVSIIILQHDVLEDSESEAVIAFLGIVPVVRLLRCLRYFETFQLLVYAFQELLQALPLLMFILLLLVLSFGAVIFYSEPRSTIPSLPLSLYFTIVSLSTVGYGDITPETASGRIWTTVLIILGPMYMAIPIGIIGNSFSEVWENRDRLLLLQRMRNCVINAGYTRSDLHRVFVLLDKNGDGTLDYEEFVGLLEIMKLSVQGEFVEQLFQSFDAGDEGSIDFHELLYGLFRQH